MVLFSGSWVSRFCGVISRTGAPCRTGRMAASGREVFESLTRRHGVKINSSASVHDCSLAVGEVVGHDKILSAARMNSAVVLFLETVELANSIVEKGVVINDIFTSVFPLSTPSKKVIISNVPPFVKDEFLTKTLSRYGKLISPIRKIAISTNSAQLKHVVSFRRFVYMTLNNSREDLDLTLNVTVDGFVYPIYVSSSVMKCFGCGQNGHLVRLCPERRDDSTTGGVGREGAPSEEAEGNPTASNASTAANTNTERGHENGEGTVPPPEASPPQSSPAGLVEEGSAPTEPAQSTVAPADCVAEDKGDKSDDNDAEDEGSQMEAEEVSPIFKVPKNRQKRRRSPPLNEIKNKTAKVTSKSANLRSAAREVETETESEFDSDCSINCSIPTSGFTSQVYTVEDVKNFLARTKHAKNVQIEQYFPDVEQFLTKAKLFIADGLVNRREYHRLRKIITKVHNQLYGTDEDGNEPI